MNVHKICAHAVLSLVFVSSATSHGMDIPKPVLVGGAVIAGAAVLVVGTKMAYWLGGLDATTRMNLVDESIKTELALLRRQVEWYNAVKEAYGPIGTENDVMVDKNDQYKHGLPNFIRAILPAVKMISTDLDEKYKTEGGVPRGAQTCLTFKVPLDKNK